MVRTKEVMAKRVNIASGRGKITDEDYRILEEFLDKTVRKAGKAKLKKYKEALKDKDDPDKSFRWGLLIASKIKIGDGVGTKGDVNLYAYMNDNQIDTALRRYVKENGL